MAPTTPSRQWKHKDLLSIRTLEPWEIDLIHDTASAFKEINSRAIKKVPALRGKTVVNLFVEPSTRTRASFELAANRLSADVISLESSSSSFKKGETLKDTGLNLQALNADFMVMRHSCAGAAQFLAERLRTGIINAGDGAHEHPSQALLDTFTIRERLGRDLKGLKIAICGDIMFSRVARSNIWALLKLGADVTLVGPSTLVPPVFKKLGVNISHKLEDILPEAHVIMLLRIQHERQRQALFPSLGEYVSLFGLTAARFRKCRPDVVIMHPGPINRGVEIDSELADGVNSVILEQVTNGMAVRMAILYLLSGGQPLHVAPGAPLAPHITSPAS
ncbi:aspartate carbamoyltransferase [Verrucomicrobia bacterium LW23]|nr:aspartate carbamoyltransferase [Verrucomicrobia bacterium LW23]